MTVLLGRSIPQKHQVIRLGLLGTVEVALHIELLELLRIADALLNDETAHHPASYLGVEADDLAEGLGVQPCLHVALEHKQRLHLPGLLPQGLPTLSSSLPSQLIIARYPFSFSLNGTIHQLFVES